MQVTKIARNAALVLVAALAFSAASRAQDYVEGSFDKTLKVSGAVDLNVSTGSGRISIHAGDSSSLHVIAKIRVNQGGRLSHGDAQAKLSKIEANPPIEQNGNSIRIGETRDDDFYRNVSISYDVTTPAETTLHSHTGSGSEELEGVKGPVDVDTGSGGIRATHIGGEIHAKTGSGMIVLESIQGAVHASTGSGGIHANGIAGGFTGDSGSGNIEVEQTAAGDVEAKTGSGGINLRGVDGRVRADTGSGSIIADGVPAGDWNLRTASGSVKLVLPPDAAFDLEARSGSGNFTTTHELTLSGASGSDRHEIHGKAHGGGPLITASTPTGSIRVE
jgi:DUF4097 and DUF4098 domain-containing protein YvlB